MVQRWHPDADGLQVAPEQSGLHVVPSNCGLEVARVEERSYQYGAYLHKAYGREEKIWSSRSNDNILPEPVQDKPAQAPPPPPKRRRKLWILLVLGLLISAAVAISVGVRITQIKQSKTSSAQQNTAASDGSPTSMSTQLQASPTSTGSTIPSRAARKDTGVLAFYPATDNDLTYLYWQDRTNDIRSLSYSYEGVWQNSDRLPIDDALNGTALAGTFYHALATPNITSYMIMYVDQNGVLQNLMANQYNQTWEKGNLGSYNFTAPTDQRIALSTRWRYSFNYAPGIGGLLLMAGGTDGFVHEYLYFYDNQTWSEGNTFAGTNGYSAAEPYIDQTNGIAYLTVMTSGSSPELEIWWQDFNNNTLRPWNKGADSIGSVRVNSSLGPISDVNTTFYINGNSELVSINVTGSTESRRWGDQNPTNVTLNSNSELGWLYITDAQAEQNPPAQGIHLFAQTNDTNLMHLRGYAGNMTVAGDVPIYA